MRWVRVLSPRTRILLTSLAAAGLTTACEGIHLYDASKNELAQGVKSGYEALELSQHLATQRENLKRLLSKETDLAGQITDHIRDEQLWLLAQEQGTGQFEDDATDPQSLGKQLLPDFTAAEDKANYPTYRLRQLGITSHEALEQAVNTLRAFGEGMGTDPAERDKTVVDNARRALEVIGWTPIWPCDRIITDGSEAATEAAGETGQNPNFGLLLKQYVTACGELKTTLSVVDWIGDPNLSHISNGDIVGAYNEWRRSQDQLNDVKVAQRAVRDIVASLKPNEGEEGPTSAVGQLQDMAGRVADLAGESEEPLKILGIEEVLTELRLDDLGILLKAVHTESLEGLDEEEAARLEKNKSLRRAAVLAAGLPGFGNSVEALIRHLRSPDARAGLLIHYAYQSARFDYLRRRVGIVEERANLQRDRLRALLKEADYFEEARQFIAPKTPSDQQPDLSDKTLSAAWTGTVAEKKNLYHALIAIENSFSVARKRAETIKYGVADTWDREGVLADEYALNAWNSVLAGPIEQLAAYHGSGVQPEAVARIVGGLASLGILGYIGVKEAN